MSVFKLSWILYSAVFVLAIAGAACSGSSQSGGGGGAPDSSQKQALVAAGAACVSDPGVYFITQERSNPTENVILVHRYDNGIIVATSFDSDGGTSDFPLSDFKGPYCTTVEGPDKEGKTRKTQVFENGGVFSATMVEIDQHMGNLKSESLQFKIERSKENALARLNQYLSRAKNDSGQSIPKEKIDAAKLLVEELFNNPTTQTDRSATPSLSSYGSLNDNVAPKPERAKAISEAESGEIIRKLFADSKLTLDFTSLEKRLKIKIQSFCRPAGAVSLASYEKVLTDELLNKLGTVVLRTSEDQADIVNYSKHGLLADDSSLALVEQYYADKRAAIDGIMVVYADPNTNGFQMNHNVDGGALGAYVTKPTTYTADYDTELECANNPKKKFPVHVKIPVNRIDLALRAVNKKVFGSEDLVLIKPMDWSGKAMNLILNSLMAHELRHALDNVEHPDYFVEGAVQKEKTALLAKLDRNGTVERAYQAVIRTKQYKEFIKWAIAHYKAQYPGYSDEALRQSIANQHRGYFLTNYREIYTYQSATTESRGLYEGMRFFVAQGMKMDDIKQTRHAMEDVMLAGISDEMKVKLKDAKDSSGQWISPSGPLPKDLIEKFDQSLYDRAVKELSTR